MNTIQYSPASYKGLSQAKTNALKQAEAATQDTNNDYKLPGYGLSFGMAKIIRNPNAKNLTAADKEFIDQCFRSHVGCFASGQRVSQDIMTDILSKYSDHDKAIEYTLAKILNDAGETTSDYFSEYFYCIKNLKDSETITPERATHLRNLPFDIKSDSGENFIAHQINLAVFGCGANPQYAITSFLNANKDEPEILYRILMTKNDKGDNFAKLGPDGGASKRLEGGRRTLPRKTPFLYDHDKETLNRYINYLTADCEAITVEDSIALLQDYAPILNEYNKEVLDILTSESTDDYLVVDHAETPHRSNKSTGQNSGTYQELPSGTKELPGGIEEVYSSDANPPLTPGAFPPLE